MEKINREKELYKLVYDLKNTHEYTYKHSIRVAEYSRFLGKQLRIK